MATIETAIVERLSQNEALEALVGDRIFPGYAPITNDNCPFVAYEVASRLIDRYLQTTSGFATTAFQFSAITRNYQS